MKVRLGDCLDSLNGDFKRAEELDKHRSERIRIEAKADIRRGFGRPADGYVDVIGVGAGVADRLRAERWSVIDFNASAKATEEARFQNKRAEAYWKCSPPYPADGS